MRPPPNLLVRYAVCAQDSLIDFLGRADLRGDCLAEPPSCPTTAIDSVLAVSSLVFLFAFVETIGRFAVHEAGRKTDGPGVPARSSLPGGGERLLELNIPSTDLAAGVGLPGFLFSGLGPITDAPFVRRGVGSASRRAYSFSCSC